MYRTSSIDKIFLQAERETDVDAEKKALSSNAAQRPSWARRAIRSLRGCLTMCWGERDTTVEDDAEEDCEPLLGERRAYVPRHARTSFLKTTASRRLQRANSIL